jgi:hypothetical protein
METALERRISGGHEATVGTGLGAGDGNRTRVASLEDLYARERVFGSALAAGLGRQQKGRVISGFGVDKGRGR